MNSSNIENDASWSKPDLTNCMKINKNQNLINIQPPEF